MLEELWTEVCNIMQEAVNGTLPKKRNSKKAKWLSEEVLQFAKEKIKKKKRREAKSKGERERRSQLNADFQRTAHKDKAFFNEQCIKLEENNRRGKTVEIS